VSQTDAHSMHSSLVNGEPRLMNAAASPHSAAQSRLRRMQPTMLLTSVSFRQASAQWWQFLRTADVCRNTRLILVVCHRSSPVQAGFASQPATIHVTRCFQPALLPSGVAGIENSWPPPEPVPPRSSRFGCWLPAVAVSVDSAAVSAAAGVARPAAQADLRSSTSTAQHAHLDAVADFDDVLGTLDLLFGEFRNVHQPFQARLQLTNTPKLVSLVTLPVLSRRGDSGLGCRPPTDR